jgi:pimeloyl-ACP methyl ester carboxylesterase
MIVALSARRSTTSSSRKTSPPSRPPSWPWASGLCETSRQTRPRGLRRWKSIPSWFVFGELDKNIPVTAHRFMAERAGAREVVEIEGTSHAVGVSHAEEVADIILRAIKAVE